MISPTAWRNAILAIFAANGLAISSLLARLPGLRDQLGLEVGEVGILLFFLSVGSVSGLVFASHVVHHLGARRTIRVMLSICGVASGLVGICGDWAQSVQATAAALVLLGASSGMNDVAMNVDGAAAERALGRYVMPWFHAAFSAGTIVGAGVAALAASLDVPIAVQTCVTGVVVLVVALVATHWVPPLADEPDEAKPSFAERMSVWMEPRTLMIGLLVLGFAYAEGSANDWLALALVDGRGLDDGEGALMLMIFTIAMTAGRIVGPWILDRYGRVPVLLGTAVLAMIGLSMVIYVPLIPVVIAGIVLWGLGSSLGFPVGMSAAADDPARAAARVSAVALVGYLAFLGGPPLVGLVAHQIDSTLHALTVVLALVVMAGLVSPAARPLREDQLAGRRTATSD